MAGSATSSMGSENVDRISHLPEHLLSDILSLLPTKHAVRSAIFSKRWRFLWTTITTIEILINAEIFSKTSLEFALNRLLLQRSSPSLHTLNLSIFEFTDDSLVNEWISAAGRLNVKHIRLTITKYHVQCNIVRNLFDCKDLEVLKLYGSGIFFNIPKSASICFPTLKVLHLVYVEWGEIFTEEEGSVCCFPVLHTLSILPLRCIESDDTVNLLLRHCPVLEVLKITNLPRNNSPNLQICSPLLRRFELSHEAVCKVEIDSSVLEYVTIVGLIEKLVLKQIPDSLVEAHILVGGTNIRDDENVQLMRHFPPVDYVKYLAITNSIIGSTNLNFPLFCNLIRLEVALWCLDMSYLRCFLERSVNLQHLFIRKVPCGFGISELGNCGYEESDVSANGTENLRRIKFLTVPTCLISSLKNLRIEEINGCPNEVALVKYMLKNSKVLENVVIGVNISGKYGDKKWSKLARMISSSPIGSAVCKVEVHEYT